MNTNKPCPHCGGKANLRIIRNIYFGGGEVFVGCDKCGARTKWYHANSNADISDCAADAKAAWNMRGAVSDNAKNDVGRV